MPITYVTRICETCKGEFKARPADVNRGWARFCSKRCKAIQQEQRTRQNASYHASKQQLEEERMHHEACIANEAGWDGHKNY